MFGHGKHACSGRFYASLQAKMVLIFTLANFVLRLVDSKTRPRDLYFADGNLPDPKVEIRFPTSDGTVLKNFDLSPSRLGPCDLERKLDESICYRVRCSVKKGSTQ